MKNNLLLLILIIPTFIFSQEVDSEIQKLSNKIVPDFCGCLQEYNIFDSDEKFGNCFAVNLTKYDKELSKFFSKDTTQLAQEKNNRFIVELFTGMQEKLFNDCDEYYLYIKGLKENAIKDLKSLDINKKLDSLNTITRENRNSDYHFRKGSLLFANNEFDNAENEILLGLNESPDNYKYKNLLAWIKEEQGDKSTSVKIYDEIFQQSGKVEFMLFREFTKRNFQHKKKKTLDCSDFKTGKFKMGGTQDKRLVYVTRDDKYQIETSPDDNSVTKMKIEWIDSCNYVVKYIESSNADMDEYIGTELKVRILETNGKTMKFKATMDGVEYVMINEMVKIE